MPKSAKNRLNGVEIIKRRDGVAAIIVDEQLDAESCRALADARLRALAFALGTRRGSFTGAEDLQDAELLSYLLDILPEGRRMELETVFRGNARVFGRLVALRSAINTPMDERDRHWAEHPLRKIPRRTIRTLEVRSVGQILEFRDALATNLARTDFNVMVTHREAEARFEWPPVMHRAAIPSKLSQIQPGSKTRLKRIKILERATSQVMAGKNLLEHAQTLFAEWKQLNFVKGSSQKQQFRTEDPEKQQIQTANLQDEANQIGERLADVLLRLQQSTDELRDEGLRDEGKHTNSLEHETSEFQDDAFVLLLESSHIARLESAEVGSWPPIPSNVVRDWSETMSVQAGPWLFRLEGTFVPSPTLAVTLLSLDAQGTPDLPLLTLVRPKEGFEAANIDSSGLAKFHLSAGQSALLVQGEKEVWEVRLTVGLA
jgi:hypothetical protein